MIGAGSTYRDGWVRLDANPRHRPDILATIPPLPVAVTCEEWDEIEWIHGVTSLYPWEALEVLKEIRGVLAPGGRLALEQPDVMFAAKKLADGALYALDWFFGDPVRAEPLHMNRWGYTPQLLTQTLEEAGFINIAVAQTKHHDNQRDFRIEAWI